MPPPPVAFHYTQTDSFVALLQELRATVLVSTYQANKLVAVRASGQGLSTLVRTFDKPMGLAVDGSQLAVGTRKEVGILRNAPDIAPQIQPPGTPDACYLPQMSHVTGDIGIQEIAWGGEERWVVSTRFSCLATLTSRMVRFVERPLVASVESTPFRRRCRRVKFAARLSSLSVRNP
jgi:uncharacterized protein (TIGR03032 family)